MSLLQLHNFSPQSSTGAPFDLLQGNPVHHIEAIGVVWSHRFPCQLRWALGSLHGRVNFKYRGNHLLLDDSPLLQFVDEEEAQGDNGAKEAEYSRGETSSRGGGEE